MAWTGCVAVSPSSWLDGSLPLVMLERPRSSRAPLSESPVPMPPAVSSVRAPPGMPLLLLGAWMLGLAALGLVWSHYDLLPSQLPVYRSLTGASSITRDKTLLLALRVPLISLLQLAVVTAFAVTARDDAARGWRELWIGAAAALGVKALLEALELSLLGTSAAQAGLPWVRGGVALAVTGFALFGLRLWRRGSLPAAHLPGRGVHGRGLTWLTVAAGGLYAVLATLPVW